MTTVTVLIVDDDETDRFLTRHQLRKSNLVGTIIEADDGATAYTLFANGVVEHHLAPHPPPTLVLLDVNMPILSGLDLLERLQRDEELRAASISVAVVVTSSTHPEDRQRAERSPLVGGYLEKPLLLETIQPYLERLADGQIPAGPGVGPRLDGNAGADG